jgi:hypothetical protein
MALKARWINYFFVLLLMLIEPSAKSQPVFINSSPGPRATHSLVYDDAAKSVLLLDGYYPGIRRDSSQIWSWDGVKWTCIDSSGPASRYAASSVYNGRNQTVITYGGRVGHPEKIIGDTWQWDGHRWIVLIENGEHARDHAAMVYDESNDLVILFGGGIYPRQSGPWATDTWAFNGKAWTRVAKDGPVGRVTNMVYDSKRKQVVLFGGVGAPPSPGAPQPNYNDTWIWNGEKWKNVCNDGPSPRDRYAMAFDDKRGIAWLHGGSSGQAVYDDLWKWDGEQWTKIIVTGLSPGKRCLHAMTYDKARDRLVLYGGNDGSNVVGDTWEWDGNSWERK